MRLKEDKSSWRSKGILRRDARHVKDGPEIEKPKSKVKDTKRWCAGKVGKAHKLKWVETSFMASRVPTNPSYFSYEKCCELCGKKFDYWSVYSRRPKPEGIP